MPQAITYLTQQNGLLKRPGGMTYALLSKARLLNKNNGDCVEDPPTLARLIHRHRDLELLGEYLLNRHQQAIADSGMDGKAILW